MECGGSEGLWIYAFERNHTFTTLRRFSQQGLIFGHFDLCLCLACFLSDFKSLRIQKPTYSYVSC